MLYKNFLIQITGQGYGEYRAEVTSSPAGETISGFPIPDPLQITALRSKLAANPSESGLRGLGTLLFETLFTGDLVTLLRRSQSVLRADEGLRIQLAIEPNEISALPWELLFDPQTKQFLALSNHTTLVRYLLLPRPPRPLLSATALPLRILALFSSPVDMPPINRELKQHVMIEALSPLLNSGLVELIIEESGTVWGMVQALHARPVHILYYQGHVSFDPGTRASYFLFEDDTGAVFMNGMEQLSDTLRNTNVRLAIINSCGMASGTLAYDLVRRGILGVVATQEPLSDIETSTFLRDFSQALVSGLPVDAAVSQGRLGMWFMSGLQGRWASPIIVVRELDAALFSLEERP
jgi:hypothetical protein